MIFGAGFSPRKIESAFTDTAEIATKPAIKLDDPDNPDSDPIVYRWFGNKTFNLPDADREDNKPGDNIRYTLFEEEIVDPAEPDKPPEIVSHHCFTFAYSGDLDGLDPGSTIAFTGPSAPPGLKLESVKDGPW